MARNWYTAELGDVKDLRSLLDGAAQPRRRLRRLPDDARRRRSLLPQPAPGGHRAAPPGRASPAPHARRPAALAASPSRSRTETRSSSSGRPLARARVELDGAAQRLERLVVAAGEREPAGGRVRRPRRGPGSARSPRPSARSAASVSSGSRNRSASKYHSQADGVYASPGLPPIASTVVPGSAALRVPSHGRVAEEDDRPGGRVERLAVELEGRPAGEHDVDLLVPEALLAVALDDVVARRSRPCTRSCRTPRSRASGGSASSGARRRR